MIEIERITCVGGKGVRVCTGTIDADGDMRDTCWTDFTDRDAFLQWVAEQITPEDFD